MALKTGTWTINIFGMEGKLSIGPTVNGEINAVLTDLPANEFNGTLRGLFDETSQEIVFGVDGNFGGVGNVNQFDTIIRGVILKGHLFAVPKSPQPGQDITWYLTGSVEVLDLGILGRVFQSNARRTRFGWFAHIIDTQ